MRSVAESLWLAAPLLAEDVGGRVSFGSKLTCKRRADTYRRYIDGLDYRSYYSKL